MATIDDKVVAMSFESSKFEEGVNKTITAIDKLKSKLDFPNAGKGLEDVSRAAKSVDLSHIGNAVDGVKNKLGALRLAGVAVMANLATQAVAAGARVVKAFTLAPLVAGFHNYETQINAVQTILANTGLKGKQGLGQVNSALAQLNTYANKTVYNFSEMAKNIGTFTAAGVDLKTSTASIKGIANLAALSGSTSEQASTAMYQLSQAIAAGQVHLQDWNSVVNAGIGGKVFQKALANTAQAMGTLKDGSVKLVGPMKQLQINGNSFRQALQVGPGKKSWLTSDVLTTTLKQFTGDMTKAQLAAIGFNNSQIKAIQAQGATALHAATNIKTFTQLQQALKEEVATAWGAIFKTIFGNLGQATTLFSKVHTVAENALTIPIYNLNKLLESWAKLGGRTALLNGIKNAFVALGAVMKPIKEAFRDIFPAATGKQLADATKRFEEFTKSLKPSPQTVENLRRTFRGLFAVLDIGKQIVGGIFHVFGLLFGAVGKGSGGFLSFTARIGDFLVSVDKALKQGGRLNNFFTLLGTIILAPIRSIEQLISAVANTTQGLHPLQVIIHGISVAWAQLTSQLKGGGNILQPIIHAFGQLGQVIFTSLSTINFNTFFGILTAAFAGGLAIFIRNVSQKGIGNVIFSAMFKNVSGSIGGLAEAFKGLGEVFGGAGEVMKGLTGNLQAFQQKLKAEALKQLAIAIALIAASAVALSLVNPQKLNGALTALTVMFGQLLGAMAILNKIGTSAGFLKLPVITASMIALGVAVDLLTIAVLGLSRLDWNQLAKGLTGVGGILLAVSVTAKPLGANSAGLIRAGVGISAIGIALNILALAVRQFGAMDMASLGKGLGSIVAALAGIGAASRAFPSGMIQLGIGLGIVAGALLLLQQSVSKFGGMNWAVIGRGIAGIGGALIIIGVAMRTMPKGMIAQAVAIGIVALALHKIAEAVTTFGGLTMTQIAKGLGVLAGALVILGLALTGMESSVAGAAALAVAAAGIALLVPAIKSLGEQSWGEIIKSMVALAAALAILGVASVLLAPASPALLALGAALVLIGGGLALAGAGVALLGVGLSAIAVAGPVAVGIMLKSLQSIVDAVPKLVAGIVNSLLSVVQKISQVAPQFVQAIVKIISVLVAAIPPLAPKLGEALIAVLLAALKVLSAAFPKVVEAGLQMLLSLLKGIKDHITEVANLAIDIAARFLAAIANKIPEIIGAGANLVIKLAEGIANNAGKILTAAAHIIESFVSGLGKNLAKIVTVGATAIARFLEALAKGYPKVIKAGADIVVRFITGIANAGARIATAGATAMGRFITAMVNASLKLVNTGAQAVVKFLNGVAGAINKYEPQIFQAGLNIGKAIINGMIKGLADLLPNLLQEAEHVISSLPGKFLHKLGIHSPSTVFYEIGKNVMQGLANGISDNAVLASDAAVKAANHISKGVAEAVLHSRDMVALGRQINGAFAQGLLGSPDNIKGAFNNLNQKFSDLTSATNQKIKTEEDRLKKLEAVKKKNRDESAIKDTKESLAEANAFLSWITSAHTLTSKKLDADKAKLIGYANQLSKVQKQLDDANTALDNAIKTRDDFAASTKTTFGALPDIVTTDADGNKIDPQTQVDQYTNSLGVSAKTVGDFANQLQTLVGLGLNSDVYQQILNIGPAASDFVSALSKMGPDAIAQINSLDTQLQNAATTIGTQASVKMYQAGVDTAQSLVDGLTNGVGDKQGVNQLKKAIQDLADYMVKTIKERLRIKSPSEVFAEIGQQTNAGMAQGLSDSTKVVTDAVYGVSSEAIAAMKKGMGGVSDIISANIDANPTITPVLDLTHIHAGADQMNSILNAGANVSAGHANAISASSGKITKDQLNGVGAQAPIQFVQNNHSPEALTPIEIYRQTKNLISQAKPVLT